jgi:hypothetical protein
MPLQQSLERVQMAPLAEQLPVGVGVAIGGGVPVSTDCGDGIAAVDPSPPQAASSNTSAKTLPYLR